MPAHEANLEESSQFCLSIAFSVDWAVDKLTRGRSKRPCRVALAKMKRQPQDQSCYSMKTVKKSSTSDFWFLFQAHFPKSHTF